MLPALKSWKTTIAGVLAAVTLIAQAVLEAAEASAKVRAIAAVVNAITLAALGILARDNTKTSEDVGATHAGPATTGGASQATPRAPDPPVPGAPVAATVPQGTIPELSPPGREPQ